MILLRPQSERLSGGACSSAPLGGRETNPAILKKAFHRASLALHPDRLQTSRMSLTRKAEAEEAFKTLSAAYTVAAAEDNALEA